MVPNKCNVLKSRMLIIQAPCANWGVLHSCTQLGRCSATSDTTEADTPSADVGARQTSGPTAAAASGAVESISLQIGHRLCLASVTGSRKRPSSPSPALCCCYRISSSINDAVGHDKQQSTVENVRDLFGVCSATLPRATAAIPTANEQKDKLVVRGCEPFCFTTLE